MPSARRSGRRTGPGGRVRPVGGARLLRPAGHEVSDRGDAAIATNGGSRPSAPTENFPRTAVTVTGGQRRDPRRPTAPRAHAERRPGGRTYARQPRQLEAAQQRARSASARPVPQPNGTRGGRAGPGKPILAGADAGFRRRPALPDPGTAPVSQRRQRPQDPRGHGGAGRPRRPCTSAQRMCRPRGRSPRRAPPCWRAR